MTVHGQELGAEDVELALHAVARVAREESEPAELWDDGLIVLTAPVRQSLAAGVPMLALESSGVPQETMASRAHS